MVDDDVPACVGKGGDRRMHRRDEALSERGRLDDEGAVDVPLRTYVRKEERPHRLPEKMTRQGIGEPIDAHLQPRVRERVLKQPRDGGLAAARGAVEKDDPARMEGVDGASSGNQWPAL